MQRLAIIDIGSNSIKATVFKVADRGEVARRSEQVRIFPSEQDADIPLAKFKEAAAAVGRLADFARSHGSDRTVIVGTSAVRESKGARELARHVRQQTGLDVNVLSGESEARVFARGVRSDPAYSAYPDLLAFDLGGGSLEIVTTRSGEIRTARSLPLGSVRLTSGFIEGGESPLSERDVLSVSNHVATLAELILNPRMAESHLVLGAGGAFTAVAMHLEAVGEPLQSGRIPTLRIRELRDRLCKLGLAARREVPGVPADRADIMPVALITICTLADLCGAEAFHLTHHGVRHGMLDVMLSSEGTLL
ncbi:MAG: hypothetical protein RJA37_107 [Verrucomicrobiota bacterium]|jgi:exopolyphosphatase/guanosine-5'-triphosphate,3'-diphosphate pyrophosphatase